MADGLDHSRLDRLEIPLGSIHKDWGADWCPSIRSAGNRKAIAQNPRLARRAGASLARQIDLQPVETGMANPADLHAFRVLSQDPVRFIHLAGLASVSPTLAGIVDRETVRALHAEFQVDDLKIALSCREAIAGPAAGEVDPARLAMIVGNAGPRMVQAWAETLPPALRGRVRLMMPKALFMALSHPNDQNINHDQGKVIRRLAERLVPPSIGEMPEHGWTR